MNQQLINELIRLRYLSITEYENRIKQMNLSNDLIDKIIEVEINSMIDEIHDTIKEWGDETIYWIFEEAADCINEFIKEVLRKEPEDYNISADYLADLVEEIDE